MKDYQIIIEQDENGTFVGEVKGIKSCYSQAKTIPELLERLVEVADGRLQLLKKKNTLKKLRYSLTIENA